MTDGNMGIQVAPTEDEMRQVQSILQRAINSIVSMSQLSADVETLRQTVSTLQADTERLRQQNAGLDEALFQSRKSRDELTSKLAQAEHDRDAAKADYNEVINTNDRLARECDRLTNVLHVAGQRSDDFELKSMDLEDKLREANDKLDKVRSIFGVSPPAVQEVKPEPGSTIETILPQEPSPSAPILDFTPTPEPVPETRRFLTDWEPGAIWDPVEHAYYLA